MEVKGKDDFLTTISKGRTIVFFCSSNCSSCRSIQPFFEEQTKKCLNENLKFIKLNITDVPEIAQAQNIRSVPTFISFVDGIATKRFTGIYRDELERMIEKNLKMMN